MISQEKFDQIELDHDCGYWFECCDRACPCAITTENKGLRQDIWDGFKKEQREFAAECDNNDFQYEFNSSDNDLDLEDDYEEEACGNPYTDLWVLLKYTIEGSEYCKQIRETDISPAFGSALCNKCIEKECSFSSICVELHEMNKEDNE